MASASIAEAAQSVLLQQFLSSYPFRKTSMLAALPASRAVTRLANAANGFDTRRASTAKNFRYFQ